MTAIKTLVGHHLLDVPKDLCGSADTKNLQ